MFGSLTSLTGGGGLSGGPTSSSARGDAYSASDMGGASNAGIVFGSKSDPNNMKWFAVAGAVVLLFWLRKGGK